MSKTSNYSDISAYCWETLGQKIVSREIKQILDKYKRPGNCEDMRNTRVNPEIWNLLNSKKKKTDLQFANLQQLVQQVAFKTLHKTNEIIAKSLGNDTLITQQVDAIAMLGHLNAQISQLRRDQIRPALRSEYSSICSTELSPNSEYLLWGDFAKKKREVKEASRISFAVTNNDGRFHNKAEFRAHSNTGHYSSYNKGKRKNFLFKGKQKPYRNKVSPATDNK